MSNTSDEILSVQIASERLTNFISLDYEWPEMPLGWQLEFIVFPDGEVVMDFLHPVSCAFWSEDNHDLEVPKQPGGKPITAQILNQAGLPYMTTFGHAAVSPEREKPHLTVVTSLCNEEEE